MKNTGLLGVVSLDRLTLMNMTNEENKLFASELDMVESRWNSCDSAHIYTGYCEHFDEDKSNYTFKFDYSKSGDELLGMTWIKIEEK